MDLVNTTWEALDLHAIYLFISNSSDKVLSHYHYYLYEQHIIIIISMNNTFSCKPKFISIPFKTGQILTRKILKLDTHFITIVYCETAPPSINSY